jgi:NAD kinase
MVEMGVYLEYLEKDQIEKFELHPFKESKKCKVNMIVTIGGDGTVLAATKLFKTGPIPPLMSLGLVKLKQSL